MIEPSAPPSGTEPLAVLDRASGCPVHRSSSGAPGGVAAATAPAPSTASGQKGCPVQHGASTEAEVQRSRADLVVRRVLRIRDRPAGVTAASAYRTFERSMLISAIRCSLTYVVFPFVLPAIGVASGFGPVLGIIVGVVAMVCDVFTIRRFFAVDHRYRWHFSAVASSVIVMLSVLLVQDILELAT